MMIALIGPAGAGKGTQAGLLAERFGFRHVSIGDWFRGSLERRTPIGLRVKRYLESGELVPDEIVESVVHAGAERIGRHEDLLLDGFPRTKGQALLLDEILSGSPRSLDAVLYLRVSDRTILDDRTPGRLTCRRCQRPYHTTHRPPRRASVCDACGGPLGRRLDDAPERVRARLKIEHREAALVVDSCWRAGKLVVVDGERPIEEVHAEIAAVVEALRRNERPAASAAEVEAIRALRTAPASVPEETVRPTIDLVLLGPPGAGKGTQAQGLQERFSIPHVATGDLFREHLQNGTDLGKLARTYMDRGELVPDDVTENMVRDRLSRPDAADGFLLDGFPRTLPQAEALADMLAEGRRRLLGVVYFDVPDEEIVKRLSGRLICRSCQASYHRDFQPPKQEGICDRCGGELSQRDDDQAETVRARLATFHRQTAPLVETYAAEGLLIRIPGTGAVEQISARAIAAVEERLQDGRQS